MARALQIFWVTVGAAVAWFACFTAQLPIPVENSGLSLLAGLALAVVIVSAFRAEHNTSAEWFLGGMGCVSVYTGVASSIWLAMQILKPFDKLLADSGSMLEYWVSVLLASALAYVCTNRMLVFVASERRLSGRLIAFSVGIAVAYIAHITMYLFHLGQNIATPVLREWVRGYPVPYGEDALGLGLVALNMFLGLTVLGQLKERLTSTGGDILRGFLYFSSWLPLLVGGGQLMQHFNATQVWQIVGFSGMPQGLTAATFYVAVYMIQLAGVVQLLFWNSAIHPTKNKQRTAALK